MLPWPALTAVQGRLVLAAEAKGAAGERRQTDAAKQRAGIVTGPQPLQALVPRAERLPVLAAEPMLAAAEARPLVGGPPWPAELAALFAVRWRQALSASAVVAARWAEAAEMVASLAGWIPVEARWLAQQAPELPAASGRAAAPDAVASGTAALAPAWQAEALAARPERPAGRAQQERAQQAEWPERTAGQAYPTSAAAEELGGSRAALAVGEPVALLLVGLERAVCSRPSAAWCRRQEVGLAAAAAPSGVRAEPSAAPDSVACPETAVVEPEGSAAGQNWTVAGRPETPLDGAGQPETRVEALTLGAVAAALAPSHWGRPAAIVRPASGVVRELLGPAAVGLGAEERQDSADLERSGAGCRTWRPLRRGLQPGPRLSESWTRTPGRACLRPPQSQVPKNGPPHSQKVRPIKALPVRFRTVGNRYDCG